jgi:ferredoxin
LNTRISGPFLSFIFYCLSLGGRGGSFFWITPDEGCLPNGQTGLIDQVNAILAALFDCPDGVRVSSIEDLPRHLSAIARGPLARPFFFSGCTNRRQGLAAVLGYLMEESGRELRLPAYVGHSFATLSCDTGKCTGCLACLNECRIAALTTDANGMLLQFREALCVDCGICRSVCPEDALSVTGGALLSKASFQPVLLARAEPMTCRNCGKVFGTRQGFERVMAILTKRETVNTTHFEFCDLCRVAHLFEAQAYE